MPGHGNRPRISLKICEICGREYKPHTFEHAKSSRTCSRKCYNVLCKTDPELHQKLHQTSINNLPKDVAGKNNPNYKGERSLVFTCVICGKIFERGLSQGPNQIYKTCSKECLSKLKSQNMSGENNPVWKGGFETIICLTCKQKFTAPPSSSRKFCSQTCYNSGRAIKFEVVTCQNCKKQFSASIPTHRRFCSHLCFHEWSRAKPTRNSNWKGGPVVSACIYCEHPFETYFKDQKFCSYACKGAYWSEQGFFRGENNPSWRGGISKEPYPFEFDKDLKQQIRRRDNFTCQLCGKSQDEHFKQYREQLSCHHINYLKDDLRPENLISLCRSCHSKTHHNRPHWQSLFEARIVQIYSPEAPL